MLLLRACTLFATLLVGFSKSVDIGLSTKCVSIPKDLSMCNEFNDFEMRMPNLMGHTSLEEVVPKSEEWKSLLNSRCHPYARPFLCSLFAPACMDAFILPCRSTCIAVKASCAPILACHGHSWPEALDCHRFPSGEEGCLFPLSKHQVYMHENFPKPTCQNCPAIEESVATKTALDAFCENSFAVKVKLVKRKAPSSQLQELEIDRQVDFISQGGLLPYDTRDMITQWMLINESCAEKMMSNSRSLLFVMAGNIPHGKVIVTRIFHWQKRDSDLALAVRKWRNHKC